MRRLPSRTVILLAASLALLAKLVCAATTLGTNDTDTFYNFGRFIWEHGLLAQYRATTEFNHTPLVGWFCAAIYGLGHGFAFNWLLRLPGILADFLSVGVLLRWSKDVYHGSTEVVSHQSGQSNQSAPRPGALNTPLTTDYFPLILLALSPVNFMISGYHGNVDSVLAWLLLLATRECLRDRAIPCALFFGLACQVKIIPLLLAPAFFFFWLHRRQGRAFFLTASATILAGWSVPLLFLPGTFLHQVLGYNSNWGSWGLTWLLRLTGATAFAPAGFRDLTSIQLAIMSGMKLIIIAAALGLAWRRRALPASQLPATITLIWTVFFVFAPGVGAQYLVWFAPLLLLTSARWYTIITIASSVFLFAFYHIISGGLPWYHGVSTIELLPRWVAWNVLPWAALTAFLISTRLTRHWERQHRPTTLSS